MYIKCMVQLIVPRSSKLAVTMTTLYINALMFVHVYDDILFWIMSTKYLSD